MRRVMLAGLAAAMMAGAAQAQGTAPIGSAPLPPPGAAAPSPPVVLPAKPAVKLLPKRSVAPHRVTAPSQLGRAEVLAAPTTPLRRKPHAPAHPHAATPPKPPAARAAPPAAPPVAPAAAAAAAGAVAAAAAPAPEAPKADPGKGTVTGLPLPRWVAFRSDEVNLRSGPGMQYPIEWVYHRRDLPVRLLREYDQWRLVEDQDGTKGWVHQATLTGRRGFLVTGPDDRILRTGAGEDASAVARLRPGVVGAIRSCAAKAAWCEVQAGSYRGWLKRTDIRGVDADDQVN